MRVHIILITLDIITYYNLNELVGQYGWIYMEIIQGMYGLLQSGIIENNLLA